MRVWRSLTGRGRGLAVVGLIASVAAVWAGQRDLGWIAALMVLLPVLALLGVAAPIRGIRVRRTPRPEQVAVGELAEVDLQVESARLLPTGLLRLSDTVDPSLGPAPRFSIDALGGHWTRHVTYRVHPTRRGRRRLGPLVVRSIDPLGLAQIERTLPGTSEILVTPVVHPLDRTHLGSTGFAADATTSSSGLVGQDDVVVRDYVRGDDLRRVHWRSSARLDHLMVRREEQAWDPRALILIDSRISAHAGEGASSSFEWVVSAAASIGTHLLERGFSIGVADASGVWEGLRDLEQEGAARWLLGRLAELDVDFTSTFDSGALGRGEGANDLVIALLGKTSAVDVGRLLAARDLHSGGIAFCLDVGTFEGRPPSDLGATVDALRSLRWRTVPVTASLDVPSAWAQLAQQEVGA